MHFGGAMYLEQCVSTTTNVCYSPAEAHVRGGALHRRQFEAPCREVDGRLNRGRMTGRVPPWPEREHPPNRTHSCLHFWRSQFAATALFPQRQLVRLRVTGKRNCAPQEKRVAPAIAVVAEYKDWRWSSSSAFTSCTPQPIWLDVEMQGYSTVSCSACLMYWTEGPYVLKLKYYWKIKSMGTCMHIGLWGHNLYSYVNVAN